jgi:hypothetical protein
MNDADDQLWLDSLAGREAAHSPTAREARVLRTALRDAEATREKQPSSNVVPFPDASREDALITRAIREGLIAPAPAPRSKWPWAVAATVLVMTAGLIGQMQLQQRPAVDVVRGDETGIVRLKAADPAALKQTLLAELRAVGVSATGYEALGVHGIDADLPLPLSADMKRVLAAHGIAEPADGVLRIEIRSEE